MLSEEVRNSSQCSGWSIAWMVGHVTDGGEQLPGETRASVLDLLVPVPVNHPVKARGEQLCLWV